MAAAHRVFPDAWVPNRRRQQRSGHTQARSSKKGRCQIGQYRDPQGGGEKTASQRQNHRSQGAKQKHHPPQPALNGSLPAFLHTHC
jgi:hypothetical protein